MPECRWRDRLVNSLPLPPPFFSDLRILKGFKSFVFGPADCKGVMGEFFGSADSKGLNVEAAFGSRALGEPGGGAGVRINVSDNRKEGSVLVIVCQGPIGDEDLLTSCDRAT